MKKLLRYFLGGDRAEFHNSISDDKEGCASFVG